MNVYKIIPSGKSPFSVVTNGNTLKDILEVIATLSCPELSDYSTYTYLTGGTILSLDTKLESDSNIIIAPLANAPAVQAASQVEVCTANACYESPVSSEVHYNTDNAENNEFKVSQIMSRVLYHVSKGPEGFWADINELRKEILVVLDSQLS